MLKTKISAKTTSLGISNTVTPRPQKNHRILVKLNKKRNIFWAQTGSKLPPPLPPLLTSPPLWLRQWVIRNSQIAKFQFLCIFCSWLYLEEAIRFFGLGPNCGHFGGFEGNNSRKQHHTELKFWPLVVFIFVQILYKAFWKTWIFTEAGDVHKVSVFGPTLTPIYPLKMTQIKNSYLAIQINKNQSPISFQFSMKTIITFCSIWAFFTGQTGNRYYTFWPFVWLWTYF